MKFLGWVGLSVGLNIGLFGWMRHLVDEPEEAPRQEAERAKVRVVEFETLPPPKPPEPQKTRSKPDTKALAVAAAMPAMPAPAMALSPARPTQSLSAPVVARPTLGPVSVKGRMTTGPAPVLASKGGGQGAGRAMQAVSRAAPEPTLRVPPRYPPAAQREGIEGWVKVSFVINEKGRPTKVQAISAQPEDVFETAAVRAVRRWSYPKQPQPLKATVTLEFKMQEGQ